ncbi:MAG: CBS domain-containing protein [Alphaproteobacteria bacterium]|nr:CBS domain-containing protein [Alphaproteobacteria bacterium]
MTDSSESAEPPQERRPAFWRRLARRIRGSGAAQAVEDALRASEERGDSIGVAQKDMILKAARFDTLRVEDVMRPRAEIVALEANATLAEAARIFSESQHSRLPIFRETLDDPCGFAHVRDVMALLAPDEEGATRAKPGDRLLMRIKRDILCVPQSMRLSALFLTMQSSRIHLALVIDEYGGTHGLVSMEDLVEQIVGDIDDEHDVDSEYVHARPGGAVDVDGRADIAKVAAALNEADLDLPDHEDEFDTAAGMAMALAGRVPQRGEILRHPSGFDVEIVDADPRRVKRLRIKPAPQSASTSSGANGEAA